MTRTSNDPTVTRIVSAATNEFAQYGIAGARIERIAKAAQTSKERVYAHFRGKAALYRFVAGRELAAMAEAVDLDPADLPSYAGRLFDHTRQHPQRHRLMVWGQLEMADSDADDDPVRESLQRKVDTIRAAQRDGLLDSSWTPEDVLVFVTQLATSWATQTQLLADERQRATFFEARRQAIVAAVQRLFPAVDRPTALR